MKTIMIILMVLGSTLTFAQNKVKTIAEDGTVKTKYVQEKNRVAVFHYHQNGQVKETGYFKNGTPDGTWETFSKDGAKTAELTYKDGKRHGEFRVWDPFSDEYIEMHYKNGEITSAKKYKQLADFASHK